jgi:hypothetical protein
MNPSTRKFTAGLLSVGIVGCLALLPWGEWLRGRTSPDAALSARLAEYVALRQADDWVGVYALTDARDRKLVPIQRFLTLYGSGAIRTVALTEKSRQIDLAAGTAMVELTLDGELRLDRLPAAARRTLAPHDPSALRQSGEFTSHWAWRDGTWWLRMEREAVTGRTADGKPITTTGG